MNDYAQARIVEMNRSKDNKDAQAHRRGRSKVCPGSAKPQDLALEPLVRVIETLVKAQKAELSHEEESGEHKGKGHIDRKNLEKLEELIEQISETVEYNRRVTEMRVNLSTPHLSKLVDQRSSTYFSKCRGYSQLFSDLYGFPDAVTLHAPSSGVLGVLEDAQNIRSYFDKALDSADEKSKTRD